jgi:hypothetical protein
MDCSGLTSITVGTGVTSIAWGAFKNCIGLQGIYFLGDAPSADSTAFEGDENAVAYYTSGTLGWGKTLAGLPVAPWYINPNLPVIAFQPRSVKVTSIEPGTLSVSATGPGPLVFQWYAGDKSDTSKPIQGAVKHSYTTIPSENSITCWVRISNHFGSMDSDSAMVSVIRATPALAVATDNRLTWFTGGELGSDDPGMEDSSGFNTSALAAESHDGVDAARSEVFTYHHGYNEWHDGADWIQTTVTGPGKLSFWWKYEIPEFSLFSVFSFQIDRKDQAWLNSSVKNWIHRTYTIPSGIHTLRWENRAAAPSQGSHYAFLDKVNFAPGGPSAEIVIQQPAGSELTDGMSKRSFGTEKVGTTSPLKTFTIRNTGTATLKNLAVTKDGANARNFSVKAPPKTSLAPGSSTTFKVIFKPSAKGTRKATIHIKSNDPDENPFDIKLTGQGVK